MMAGSNLGKIVSIAKAKYKLPSGVLHAQYDVYKLIISGDLSCYNSHQLLMKMQHLKLTRDIEVPKPGSDDVLIEVQASPINPSDLGTLVGAGDLTSIRVEGEGEQAKVIMDIPESVMWAMKPRIGKPWLVMKVRNCYRGWRKC